MKLLYLKNDNGDVTPFRWYSKVKYALLWDGNELLKCVYTDGSEMLLTTYHGPEIEKYVERGDWVVMAEW